MLKWTRQGIWARWGWLITTLALGLALVGSAWLNYLSARQAADDLIRGEAHTLRDAVIMANRMGGGGRSTDFDSLVTAHGQSGLRFAGWVDSSNKLLAYGGSPSPAPMNVPPLSAPRDPVFGRFGSRIRVYFPPPMPPNPRPSDARNQPPSPSDSANPQPAPRMGRIPPTLVLELEPVVSAEMLERATTALVLAGIVAAVLMVAGLVFWQFSQRIEENERRMEEQRRLTHLGEMSAVLAHEIRNPLASLKGHAQLLVERLPGGSPERRKADRVVEEATRLEGLTSDLLDFARSGPMEIKPTDPVALLRASAREVSNTAIHIEGEDAPQRWPLDADRFRRAVLSNLLRNAVQASPPDWPPQARVFLENGWLVFTIRDFGEGLPAGQEERIFDPFFTTRTSGTGLGLSVARRIVELHGGRLTGENAAGGGAIFRIELPREG
jgi:two-component system sensor histidine kinase HydH